MPAASLALLRTPANGQIFGLRNSLTQAQVDGAFAQASKKKSGRTFAITKRQPSEIDGTRYWSSFICFPLTSKPAFLPDADLKEKTFGFLLLIEIRVGDEWFLGVFKQSTSSLAKWLDDLVIPLHRRRLASAFSNYENVRRMSLQRMTVSRYELRAASYEADDLQSSLPRMAATRCAIRSIRFDDQEHGSIAVTVSTSRVQKSGGRCNADRLAQLVLSVAEGVQADRENAFLGTFAQAVAFEELPAGTRPTSILFNWGQLLEDGNLELRPKDPALTRDGTDFKKKILQQHLGDVLDVTLAGDVYRIGRNRGYARGYLRDQKFTPNAILGDKIEVYDAIANESVSLKSWVRENEAYCLTFSDPRYFFAGGALYRRGEFAKEVEMVDECLQVEAALNGATSEKGEPARNATSFPADSIFAVSEDSIYNEREWLCCSDLGDEWADYLCIRDGALLFIHCKGGRLTSGASCFQEVVGQGLKNLGRTRSTPTEFGDKINQLANNQTWGQTHIRRLRDRGRNWPDFRRSVADLFARPDAPREVHLVVTMLSKARFHRDAATTKPPFIQLVWLLTSFINTCREMGAKPVIVCRP